MKLEVASSASKKQANVAMVVAATVAMLGGSPAMAKPDTRGRGLSERRVELPASRGRENGTATQAKRGGTSQPVQDVKDKTQRGVADVFKGQRRTFSGPTDRLKKVFGDRAARVVMNRRP